MKPTTVQQVLALSLAEAAEAFDAYPGTLEALSCGAFSCVSAGLAVRLVSRPTYLELQASFEWSNTAPGQRTLALPATPEARARLLELAAHEGLRRMKKLARKAQAQAAAGGAQ